MEIKMALAIAGCSGKHGLVAGSLPVTGKRRVFLRCLLVALIAMGSGLSSPCAEPVESEALSELRSERVRLAERARRLIMNNDGCDCLYFPGGQEVTEENFLKLRTSGLADTHVDSIFYCTISSGFGNFTHDTKVGHILAEPLPAFYRDAGKLNIAGELISSGTDPLRIVTDFAHGKGMECFWSMRMNDTHDVAHTPENPYYLFPALKKDHPEWLISDFKNPPPHGRWSSVNYSVAEIRDLAFRYIEEVCQNYDVDGIEMDFFRHLTYFASVANGGKASDKEREMMNQLMRRIRSMSESEGVKRGRPILLAIRVPDSVGFCRDMGLDIEGWMGEGLVDILIPSGYFRHHHWEDAVALGHEHGAQVIPCLTESRVKGETRFKRQTIEGYRGRAANAWAAGADGLEIFNVFNPESPVWSELGSSAELEFADKLYFVTPIDGTADDWMAGGEDYRVMPLLSPGHPEFLKVGEAFSTEIVVSENAEAASKRKTTLHLNLPALTNPEMIEMRFNGHVLKSVALRIGWVDYALSAEHLVKGINRIDLLLLDAPAASGGESGDWTTEYDGSEIPTALWMTDLPVQSAAITVEAENDGALLIADRGNVVGDYHYYHHEWGADPDEKNVVEARVKVASGSSFLIFGNGRSAERLRLSPGEIGLHHNRGAKLAIDTTSEFRTYRLEMQGDDLLIYVDGKLALDLTDKFVPREAYPNRVSFGAASSTEVGEAYWDSVKVRTSGAGQALRDIVISVNYGES